MYIIVRYHSHTYRRKKILSRQRSQRNTVEEIIAVFFVLFCLASVFLVCLICMDLLIVSDDHDPPASASAASVDDDRIYINLCDANIIPASPNPPHNNVVLLSDSQLLDAMEAELRLAYKMVLLQRFPSPFLCNC